MKHIIKIFALSVWFFKVCLVIKLNDLPLGILSDKVPPHLQGMNYKLCDAYNSVATIFSVANKSYLSNRRPASTKNSTRVNEPSVNTGVNESFQGKNTWCNK